VTAGAYPAALFGLDGKVAVITGAASGIGKATARLFAKAGGTVVVADVDARGAKSVAEELGPPHIAITFDLKNDQSINVLFGEVEQCCGRCDVLVNNAGIYPKYAFDELTREGWDEMQRVNVWGQFVAMREAAHLMKNNGGGRIINISSIGGVRTAVVDQIAYNASKAAIDSMTFSAALDLAEHGILVNSICPGGVAPLDPKPKPVGHKPAKGPLMDAGRMLLGRPASPDEIAGPILMLASAAGGYITGQAIVIDGGFSVS
jgi:NAD(P)-dependent dehydrogenase (short-subunit alcohol dehydrogenase family)